MTPETIGPYRILETLREGGVSSVYKAVGPSGAAVALKVFSLQLPVPPAVIQLSHPNILQVVATGQEGDRVFLATELFAGTSLERLLEERRLTIPQSIGVLRAVCRGLVFAHARGFVHGHLSPRHVLVSPDVSAVKIADFGPSELDVAAELDTTLRTGAYALGSMHYLAPEQIGRRGAPPDPRSDIYAAGAIFVELLTGRTPVGKLALPSHVNAELPPLTDIVVLRCLERDPEQRYPSAAALLADLDRLEEAMRVRLLSHLRGISRLLGPPGSTRRTVLLAALALLLVALAVAGYLVAAR
ncbi:MAG TPA: serine/threonine-protein kinase [Thermoanaerobaculia bacterium]|nr:serine/threonine-protein kinase [Thermoanaerobaculia bacterium]